MIRCSATIPGNGGKRSLSTTCNAIPVCATCGRCELHCRCAIAQADGDTGEPRVRPERDPNEPLHYDE